MYKPVVKFLKGTFEEHSYDDDTVYAKVYALNHYNLGRAWIRTSKIENMTLDGFETKNTIYVESEEEEFAYLYTDVQSGYQEVSLDPDAYTHSVNTGYMTKQKLYL